MTRLLKTLALAFGCALLMILAAGGAQAQNLLSNPGFENGLTGWTQLGDMPVIDGGTGCVTPYEGSHYVWLAYKSSLGMTNAYSLLRQAVPFTAGHTAKLTARAMHCSTFPLTGTATGVGQVLTCDFQFLNASGTVINTTGAIGTGYIDGTTPTNTWQATSFSAVAPAGTTQVRVRVMYSTVNWAQSGGLVDDLVLQDEQAVDATPTAWGQLKALYR